jgi:photosystem II stability/assembly factor-like uncharacterized protein
MRNISLLYILIVLIISSKSNAQWVQTNGPYGGDVLSLAVSGTNIFAGTRESGVFRSTNNGTSWSAVNVGFPWMPQARALVVSGTNIFVGLNGNGVYLSTDNGNSWNAVNNGLPANSAIFSLAISGTNIFAGTVNGGGIYLSTNNGTNWTAVNNGLPADTMSIQANTLTASNNNIFLGTATDGVFRSTNNGSNWIYCGFKDTTIYSIAVSGEYIFAGSWNCGIFRSNNNGASWTMINNGLNVISVNSFLVSGTNIFAGTGTGGIFLSTNNGSNWTPVNSGLPTNYFVQSLSLSSDEKNNENILAGTSSGVFISTNNGVNWTEANLGLTGVSLNSLIVSGKNLIAGTGSSGIFLSTNDGTNWNAANNGLISYPGVIVTALAVSGPNLYAGVVALPSGIYISTDNGNSWSSIGVFHDYPGCPSGQDAVLAIGIIPNSIDSVNIFVGTDIGGVHLSKNKGITWTQVDSGLPANTSIRSIAISGTNIFAGTWGNGIYLSSNNGTSWALVDSGLPQITYIQSLVVAPNSTGGNNIFANINNGIGVVLSTNNGTSWSAVNNGLPGVNILAALGTNVFCGTSNGVFLTTNNGTSWIDISSGLPTNSNVRTLTVSNTNIFAGTMTGNVWRRPLSEVLTSIWQANINIKDNGNISQSLSFGQSPLASDSIDAQLGEAPLPPTAFGFDARFHLSNGDESWKDYRSSNLDTVEWLIKFQPGTGGYPITFSWDSSELPAGNFFLKDIITEAIVNVNMKTSSSYTLTNTGINELKIEYHGIPTSVATRKENNLPTYFSLFQNYPNPFNPSTVIKYGLPKISNVKIKLYNVLGQEIASLVDRTQNAGYHEVTWNASNKASGIYLYTIEAVSADGKGSFHSAKKLILLK